MGVKLILEVGVIVDVGVMDGLGVIEGLSDIVGVIDEESLIVGVKVGVIEGEGDTDGDSEGEGDGEADSEGDGDGVILLEGVLVLVTDFVGVLEPEPVFVGDIDLVGVMVSVALDVGVTVDVEVPDNDGLAVVLTDGEGLTESLVVCVGERVPVIDLVGDLLRKEVSETDGERLIEAVGDLEDGGVIVGNAVLVIERVAGFDGVCVKLLRGDLVICADCDILILGDGVIDGVDEGVGVEEGGKYIWQHTLRNAPQLLSLNPGHAGSTSTQSSLAELLGSPVIHAEVPLPRIYVGESPFSHTQPMVLDPDASDAISFNPTQKLSYNNPAQPFNTTPCSTESIIVAIVANSFMP